MNFIVYAPGDYSPNGGGSVALHKLAHNIASLGQRTYIVTSKKSQNYLGEEISEIDARRLVRNERSIVIYPEVIVGNPLNSPHVMRWILYYVRTNEQHGIFGKYDLIYRYADHFTLRNPQHVHGELRAMELNLDVFVNKGGERSGSCYLVKKCPDKPHIHPADSLRLDNYPNQGGNYYLANVFNHKEIFYAYDSATWLSIMAALCGCVSVVIPDEGVTAEEWHSKFPYFKYGIAYGLDDLDYAKSTAHLVREHLLSIEAETIELTKAFIETAYRTYPNE